MTHDDRAAIRDAVGRLHRESGLPMVFGGAVIGKDMLRITEFVGAKSGTMRGLRVDTGSGLGGKAMALRRPVLVNDYARADAITHDYDEAVTGEGIRTMVGIPVQVGRTVRGVLYGALRGTVSIGDRVVDSMVSVGRVLEQDLAVRDALEKEHPSADAFAVSPRGGVGDRSSVPDGLGARGLAARGPDVRDRILNIADRMEDAGLRDELVALVGDLAAGDAAAGRIGADGGGMAGGAARSVDPSVRLSPREQEVLMQVAMGHTNALIAERLGVGAETVKSYLRTAMHKLSVNNRIEAVVAARRAGAI